MTPRRDRRKAEARGRLSEWAAALLLRLKGYRILAFRVRTKRGEIDLIARAPTGVLCFVEVKARHETGAGVWAVGARQQSRIAAAAGLYLAAHPKAAPKGVRFDIVSVAPWRLPRHLPDAFRPGG